jgi:hypothetical protein
LQKVRAGLGLGYVITPLSIRHPCAVCVGSAPAGSPRSSVPPARTSPNGMLSNQRSCASSRPTNPPNFHGNRESQCQGQFQPSQEHCAQMGVWKLPRCKAVAAAAAAPDTTAARRLILPRFRAGALFRTTVLSFPSLIPPSIWIRSHSSSHGTPDLSHRSTLFTAGTPASGKVTIPGLSQTR